MLYIYKWLSHKILSPSQFHEYFMKQFRKCGKIIFVGVIEKKIKFIKMTQPISNDGNKNINTELSPN